MSAVENLLGLLLLNSFLLSQLKQHALLNVPALSGVSNKLSAALIFLTLVTLTFSNVSFYWLHALLQQQLQPLNAISWLTLCGFFWSAGFLLLRVLMPPLRQLPVVLPLVFFANCVILGSGVSGLTTENSAGQVALTSTVISLGFGAGLTAWSEFSLRLATAKVPKPWRGAPIYLISAALATAGFVGLSGLL